MTDVAVYETRFGVLPSGMELDPQETERRIKLFAGMLGASAMAGNQDLEVSLEGYLELTADIPLRWLIQAVQREMMRPGPFAPSIGDVRSRAALEILRSWRVQLGKNPDVQDDGRPVVCPEKHVDHWVGRARQLEGLPEIPQATTSVAALPAGWEERLKLRAIGGESDG